MDSSALPLGCMLATQLTLFNCGGMAITVSPSRKLVDGSLMFTFIKTWASMTSIREGSSKVMAPKPIFLEPSFSPPRALHNSPMLPEIPGEFTKRRFVFPSPRIAQLRKKTTTGQQHLSDGDLVVALIMKCAILVSRSLSKSFSGPHVLFHVVNMRKRVRPLLPANTIRNAVLYNTLKIEESQIKLNELAGKIKKNLTEIYNCAADCSLNEQPESSIQGTPYCSSSLCGFPLYEMDFGWGRPSWVTSAVLWQRNIIMLQNTKHGDGIEAWISMDLREMILFEEDHDILTYASNNHSALAAYCRM